MLDPKVFLTVIWTIIFLFAATVAVFMTATAYTVRQIVFRSAIGLVFAILVGLVIYTLYFLSYSAVT